MLVGQRRQKNVKRIVSNTQPRVPSAMHDTEGTQAFSQNQNRRALDRDARESSRSPRSGVDVDAVMPDIGMRNRRMTMNDEVPVVLRRVEELMTNPKQVMEILLLDRGIGADAGVNEQEIPATKAVAQALQKQLVRARK